MAEDDSQTNASVNAEGGSPAPPEDADAPSIAPSGSEPVDINSLEVRILIICQSANQFHSVTSFLTRRGWPTEVTNSINKAVQLMTTVKPDFVLVSVNHSSPNVIKLPNLLTQTFNTTCVGFAEKTDHKSILALNSMKVRHKMMGPVSGPSIHRKIKSILHEMYGVKEAETSAEGAPTNMDDVDDNGTFGVSRKNRVNDDNVIRFKNNSQAPKNEIIEIHGKGESGSRTKLSDLRGTRNVDAESLKQLQSELGVSESLSLRGGELEGESPAVGSKSETTSELKLRQSTSEGDLKSPPLFQTKESEPKGPLMAEDREEDADLLMAKGSSSGFPVSMAAERGEEGLEARMSKGVAGDKNRDRKNDDEERDEKKTRKNWELDGIGAQGLSGKTSDFEENDETGEPGGQSKSNSDSGSDSHSESKSGSGDIGSEQSLKNRRADQDEKQERGKDERDLKKSNDEFSSKTQHLKPMAGGESPDSDDRTREKNNLPEREKNFYEIIRKALLKSAEPPEQKIQYLVTTDHVFAMQFLFEGRTRTLLMACSLSTTELVKAASRFKKEINAVFDREKIRAEIAESLLVKIRKIDFEQFANQKCQMLFTCESGSGELSIGLIDREFKLPETKRGHDNEKVIVPTEALLEHQAVTFRAYLFLPENNKYFLFLKDGSRLAKSRAERLTKAGFPLFIDRKDVEKFKALVVAGQIDEWINEAPEKFRQAG